MKNRHANDFFRIVVLCSIFAVDSLSAMNNKPTMDNAEFSNLVTDLEQEARCLALEAPLPWCGDADFYSRTLTTYKTLSDDYGAIKERLEATPGGDKRSKTIANHLTSSAKALIANSNEFNPGASKHFCNYNITYNDPDMTSAYANRMALRDFRECQAVMNVKLDKQPSCGDIIYEKALMLDWQTKVSRFSKNSANLSAYARPTNFPKRVDLLLGESQFFLDSDLIQECSHLNKRYLAIKSQLEETTDGRQMSQWLAKKLEQAAQNLVENEITKNSK